MAITWNDILNGESAASVRSKLNNLGSSLVTENTSLVNTITSNTTRLDTIEGEVDTNTTNLGTLDTRTQTLESNMVKIGFVDYNDSATQTTPISVTGGAGYVQLTNDTLGPYTVTNYLPTGITSIWNSTTNYFEWSELSLGDMLDIRLDISVTTTTPSQRVKVVLEMSSDSNPYEILYIDTIVKAAGTTQLNRYNGVYLGNTDTLNGRARFKILSDANCTVKVNGWYVKITAK